MNEMSYEEMRALSSQIAPHLFWNLKKIETYKMHQSLITATREMVAHEIANNLLHKAQDVEIEYTVLIIPTLRKLEG